MKIAICYSGQLRNCRMMIQNHINLLFIPLLNGNHTLDFFLYTDDINTSRSIVKQGSWINEEIFNWQQEQLDDNIYNYFTEKLKLYGSNCIFKKNIVNKYNSNDYKINLNEQLLKLYHVFTMINTSYDLIIRLRPDVYWIKEFNLDTYINRGGGIFYTKIMN